MILFVIMYFQIQWGACYLTLAGNIIIYLTLVGFFVTFDQDELEYNTCWNTVLHCTYLLILHGNILNHILLFLINFIFFLIIIIIWILSGFCKIKGM